MKEPHVFTEEENSGVNKPPLMSSKIQSAAPHKTIDSSFWLIKLESRYFKNNTEGEKKNPVRLITFILIY